jgi:N-methylhydantoinase A
VGAAPDGVPLHRIAVDTGGTFTDVAVSGADGRLWVDKALTTTPDVFDGVEAALAAVSAQMGTTLPELLARCGLFTYATTHATNAILTGATARTAFLTTEGFPDTLVLREGGKFGPFDHRQAYPDPYVPRALTFEVRERITSEGTVHTPLDEAHLAAMCERLGQLEVEAVGVCLLWSIREPAHELAVAEVLARELPGVPVTLSHQLNPVIREYRRASAACIDASLKPLMARHFANVRERLAAGGFEGSLLVVTSTGGVAPIGDVGRRPILVVNSGPAIAPVGGAAAAASEGLGGASIVCDMGGTSFDVSLLRDGRVDYTRETWLGGQFTGHLTGLSSVAVQSIGYGGGSIGWIDDGGLLRIGPHSAGADPGPACYRAGGVLPTLTDAAVVLGYIDPAAFLGSRMALDADAALEAVATHIAEPLDLDPAAAAAAMFALATADMAHAVEAVTTEHGLDPRGARLIGGGGASGLFLAAIAQELGCAHVLMPATVAVLSAYGGLHSDLVTDVSASHLTDTRVMDVEAVLTILGQLDDSLEGFFERVDASASTIAREFSVEARYRFQVWDLEVPLAGGGRDALEPARIEAAFHDVHERVFGVREEGQTVECVAWRGRGRVTLAEPQAQAPPAAAMSAAPRTTASASFPGAGVLATPRYDGAQLPPGHAVGGPAILELPTTTIVVPPGATARRTAAGHIVISTGVGA